jgi:hypothetical protein
MTRERAEQILASINKAKDTCKKKEEYFDNCMADWEKQFDDHGNLLPGTGLKGVASATIVDDARSCPKPAPGPKPEPHVDECPEMWID